VKRVDLIGLHVEATTGTPLVLLREQDAPHRVLPIFVGGHEAAAIAMVVSGQQPPRPLTHDLMASLVENLGAHLDSLEVTDLRDGAFLAELALSGPVGGCRIDTRPSDGIALALRLGTPLYASEAVLIAAGAQLSDVPDDGEIEAAVAEFRNALERLDASDFDTPGSDRPSEEDGPPETTEQD